MSLQACKYVADSSIFVSLPKLNDYSVGGGK